MTLNQEQMLTIAQRVEHHLANPNHWCQSEWGLKRNGMKVLFEHENAQPLKLKDCRCLCLTGTVRIAGTELLKCTPAEFWGETSERILRHYVIAGNIDMDHDPTDLSMAYHIALVRWNDLEHRTFDEVQNVAKRTAEALGQ